MSDQQGKSEQARQLLADAQAKGTGATLRAFVKLSGPGWLQSAITLGGGSLAGALFLGILGGTSLLWVQFLAIVMGVVMLSAISYVTLSTGQRPFNAINQHVNPALGWGWLVATAMANMIWCMPQFSLCFEALETNLAPGMVSGVTESFASEGNDGSTSAKLLISLVILIATSIIVTLNRKQGVSAKVFDVILKALVGMIVLCFFGVVVYLTIDGQLQWGSILSGFIPDLSAFSGPTGKVAELMPQMSADAQEFWTSKVVTSQRAIMIGAIATAVGINMTFLMPYAMLHRGWDKTFRGLARFDLGTGMAIPYVLVTTCVVIAAQQAFHATAEPEFLGTDAKAFAESATFGGAKDNLLARVQPEANAKYADYVKDMSEDEKLALWKKMAALPEAEKRVASSLVKRKSFALSKALAPLIGDKTAQYVFGLGVFGMGFSTIIILMLINGFVFCEAMGKPDKGGPFVMGCLIAGIAGAAWPLIWDGPAKMWLAILTSSFGMMLLPIAYITFFLMMNSHSLMGKEKPTGTKMLVWNVLMAISTVGATGAAGVALFDKITKGKNATGTVVLCVLIVYLILVAAGFMMRKKAPPVASSEA